MLRLSVNWQAMQDSFLFLLFFLLPPLSVGARPDLVGRPSRLILSILSNRVTQ